MHISCQSASLVCAEAISGDAISCKCRMTESAEKKKKTDSQSEIRQHASGDDGMHCGQRMQETEKKEEEEKRMRQGKKCRPTKMESHDSLAHHSKRQAFKHPLYSYASPALLVPLHTLLSPAPSVPVIIMIMTHDHNRTARRPTVGLSERSGGAHQKHRQKKRHDDD